MPLNGRDVQELVFLAPGTTNVTANYCAANCEGGVFPSEQYAKVNGGGANGVNYLLDGVDANDTYINTNVPFPNPDAIQELNLITGNMSASLWERDRRRGKRRHKIGDGPDSRRSYLNFCRTTYWTPAIIFPEDWSIR